MNANNESKVIRVDNTYPTIEMQASSITKGREAHQKTLTEYLTETMKYVGTDILPTLLDSVNTILLDSYLSTKDVENTNGEIPKEMFKNAVDRAYYHIEAIKMLVEVNRVQESLSLLELKERLTANNILL